MQFPGKIMWIRSMVLQLETFTNDFASHEALKLLPQYKTLVKEYNMFALEAVTFELRTLKRWKAEINVKPKIICIQKISRKI